MYSDQNATRRNLTVTSLAFIVYYQGEGYVPDDVVKMPLINVIIDNPGFLTVFAWTMIFWFAVRYWQANYINGIEDIRTDFLAALKEIDKKKFLDYAKQYGEKETAAIRSINVSEKNWSVKVRYNVPGPGAKPLSRTKDLACREWRKVRWWVYRRVTVGPYKTVTGLAIPCLLFGAAIVPYVFEMGRDILYGTILLLHG